MEDAMREDENGQIDSSEPTDRAASPEAEEPGAESAAGPLETGENGSPSQAESSVEAGPAPQPPAVEEADGQQSLAIDDAGAVGTPVAIPEESSAAATDLPGATHVVTYGDRDLDEMVAELAETVPAVGGAVEERTSGRGAERGHGGPLTPTWPFLAYVGAWLAYSVALVLVMRRAASAGSMLASPYYVYFLYGGLALGGIAVVLAVVVWLVVRGRRPKGQRGGMLTSALLKGATSLFAGTVMWWIAFYVSVALASRGQ